MVAQKIGQSKLSSKQIKHEDVDMVAQKMVKARCHLSKLNMKTLISLAVTINNASRIKIVAKKSGAKQSPEQVQQVIKVNIFIHEFILHQRFI